jgi:ATP-dependent protease HslVU (ClpYQ) peptidase subunit
MTCIVGIQRDGKVYLGADSAAFTAGTFHIQPIAQPKLFKNKTFIAGYTTSFRFGYIFQYVFVPPKHPKKMSNHEYLNTLFVDELRRVLKESGWTRQYEEGNEEGGVALIGYRGELYNLQGEFSVLAYSDGIAACGCGQHFAAGAMYATIERPPMKSLEIALNAAAYMSAGVIGPFSFMSL